VQEVTGKDVRKVRYQLVLRGYKMSEVDWVMGRLGSEIDELRARVSELEAERAG
jgi:DivIVA domain-containing protein